jgi:hypothetical protein
METWAKIAPVANSINAISLIFIWSGIEHVVRQEALRWGKRLDSSTAPTTFGQMTRHGH